MGFRHYIYSHLRGYIYSHLRGFLYLTIAMDLYDRKIIGWSLSDGMSTNETALVSWKTAIRNKSVQNGLIFHSDRGVQYANNKFANILESHKVTRSIS